MRRLQRGLPLNFLCSDPVSCSDGGTGSIADISVLYNASGDQCDDSY